MKKTSVITELDPCVEKMFEKCKGSTITDYSPSALVYKKPSTVYKPKIKPSKAILNMNIKAQRNFNNNLSRLFAG